MRRDLEWSEIATEEGLNYPLLLAAFEAPSWVGSNLDALHDWLTDPGCPVTEIHLHGRMPATGENFLRLLRDVTHGPRAFKVEWEAREGL